MDSHLDLTIIFCAVQNFFPWHAFEIHYITLKFWYGRICLEDTFIACSQKQLQNKLKETKNGTQFYAQTNAEF